MKTKGPEEGIMGEEEKKEGEDQDQSGMTRRGFLQVMGAGAVASAATGQLHAATAPGPRKPPNSYG